MGQEKAIVMSEDLQHSSEIFLRSKSNQMFFVSKVAKQKTSEEVFEPFPRPFKKINSFEFE